MAERKIEEFLFHSILTPEDRTNLGGNLDKSLLQLYDALCNDGVRLFSSVVPLNPPLTIENFSFTRCFLPQEHRSSFISALFRHPFFTAIKILFRFPAYGEDYVHVSILFRKIADLVIEDRFWLHSVFRNFMICCCSVVVASRWAFLNLAANFLGHTFQCKPIIADKGSPDFPHTVSFEGHPVSLVIEENSKSGGIASANCGMILTFQTADGRKTKYYSKAFHEGQSGLCRTGNKKLTIKDIIGRPDISIDRSRIAASWVAGDNYNYLHLSEPFMYLVLMHLGIGANFIGLLDVSTLGFFRICTQEVASDPVLAARSRAETLEDRAFVVLLSYLFNLEDLKGQNLIDWRVVIDFLVRPAMPDGRTALTADEVLQVVFELQKNSKGNKLFGEGKFEDFKTHFPAGLWKLRALIWNLPATLTLPLYCYTAIPEFAPLVNHPDPSSLDWLFSQPPPRSLECGPECTDEACIAKLSACLDFLVDGLVRFFFDPPAEGLPSRGALFGFRKHLPSVQRDMLLFREQRAIQNLRDYSEVVKQRLRLLLAMTE
jgi:hypothetical protein